MSRLPYPLASASTVIPTSCQALAQQWRCRPWATALVVQALGLVGQQEDDGHVVGVGQGGPGELLPHGGQALPGQGQHLVALAEVHGPHGAAVYAHGFEVGLDAVDAHVALDHQACAGVAARDVVGTGLAHFLELALGQARGLGRVDDGPGVLVDEARAFHVGIGHFQAGRGQAMAALVREEVPLDHAVDLVLGEAHQFIVVRVQVGRILMRARLLGLVGNQAVPFLAGHLAAAAGRAPCGVNQKRLGHDIAPLLGAGGRGRPPAG